ncbi:MAG: DegT/DnrJ/EryC1/StrS family aminotransferase [Armatimonadota bacterium]
MAKLAINGGTPVRTNPYPDWPISGEEERVLLQEVLDSGKWWYGEKVKAFEEQYAAYHNAKFGISCMNGSMALETGLWACGIEAGDEVIVPPYTFVATAISVLRMNAIPVFADIDLDTWNLDPVAVEKKITAKTKAIMPVHFGGLPVDMDAFNALGKQYGVKIIEDACHSWGGKWNGKGTGALGACGAFSFQVSKNMTAGEGGILLTDDEEIADFAYSFINYGRGKQKTGWYRHMIPGTNLRMTEFQAAVLLGQLSRLEAQTRKRQENAEFLNAELANTPGLSVQQNDPRANPRTYHLYLFRFLEEEWPGVTREQFLDALRAEGIPASSGYPNSLQYMPVFSHERAEGDFMVDARPYYGKDVDYAGMLTPNSDQLCKQACWLTQNVLLAERQDMQDIVDAIVKIRDYYSELVHA